MQTTNFEGALKACLIERGNMGDNWRLEIISRDIIGNSDIATVTYKMTPPRCRKGYLQSVNVNFVRGLVYWDTLTASIDRV